MGSGLIFQMVDKKPMESVYPPFNEQCQFNQYIGLNSAIDTCFVTFKKKEKIRNVLLFKQLMFTLVVFLIGEGPCLW